MVNLSYTGIIDYNMFTIIPADNFIWNQKELIKFLAENQQKHIKISLNAEGPDCQILGLYNLLDNFNFESVNIITANILEAHNKYKITHSPVLRWAYVREHIESKYHIWNQNKIFCAYYGRPLWHRIGLVSYLKTYHDSIAYVNLRGDYNSDNSRKLFELAELFYNAPEQMNNFASIANQLPFIIETQDSYSPGEQDTTGFTKQLLDFYGNILIDVVAETFTSGKTFFPTEKTFRPMLMKKPFILMGPINNLIYLRQMGFKTFYEYWDEDYDGFSPRLKFQKIIQLINNISKKSKSELCAMYQDMQHILDHNYNLLVSKKYIKQITLVND
jgi:hypothetical protein